MGERMICGETMWSNSDGQGGFTRGHTVPCKAKAKYLAKWPFSGGDWTPLCGRHANTGRWANYPGIEWRDL